MKNHKASLIINLCTLLIIFSSSSLAFNITKILSQRREFETLNSLLSKTKLADEINRRQTITLLAVENSGLLSLAGKPLDVAKNILSVHVVLDYYDVEKLTKLGISSNTTTLTTLFQASGLAVGLQGFVNVSLVDEGEIAFGSAASGGTLASKLVQSVVAHPYNLSVLQITAPVHVPGIESAPGAHPPPPPAPVALVPVPAPKKSPKLPAPTLPPAAPKISPKPAPTLPPPQKKSPPPAPVFPPAPKNSPKPAPVLAPAPKNSPKPGPVLAPSLAPTTPVSNGPVMSAAPASSPSKPDDSSADSEPPGQNTSGGSRGLTVGVGAAGAALVAALAVSYCLVA